MVNEFNTLESKMLVRKQVSLDFDGFIFDLDGTLLNTLPDIVLVINKALTKEGFPAHTQEEILTLIGDGAQSLVLRAVPAQATPKQAQAVFQNFRTMYAEFGLDLTQHYPGMLDTLRELKQRRKKLGIMSNKFEGGVKSVVQKFFSEPVGLIDAAHGEREDIPRKPEPDGLLLCAKEMGCEPGRCAYFGDSSSDMQAAHNAGMHAVGVTWGYQPLEQLETGRPDTLISSPQEILSLASA